MPLSSTMRSGISDLRGDGVRSSSCSSWVSSNPSCRDMMQDSTADRVHEGVLDGRRSLKRIFGYRDLERGTSPPSGPVCRQKIPFVVCVVDATNYLISD